jgi:hypothetical protein
VPLRQAGTTRATANSRARAARLAQRRRVPAVKRRALRLRSGLGPLSGPSDGKSTRDGGSKGKAAPSRRTPQKARRTKDAMASSATTTATATAESSRRGPFDCAQDSDPRRVRATTMPSAIFTTSQSSIRIGCSPDRNCPGFSRKWRLPDDCTLRDVDLLSQRRVECAMQVWRAKHTFLSDDVSQLTSGAPRDASTPGLP